MITVQEALKTILNQTEDFGVETIPFLESDGRILKESIKADRDFPPFDRVAMDGIAINTSHHNKSNHQYNIEGIQAAGSPQLFLKNPLNCMEAMTGATLPKNTNAVVQYELTNTQNGVVTLQTDQILPFKNIHKKGTDCKKGEELLKPTTIISAAEIGVLASVGKSFIKVAKQPKVCVISTGDELVEVNKTPLSYQIRRSNVYTLVTLLKRLYIKADTIHIKDDKALLTQTIKNLLK